MIRTVLKAGAVHVEREDNGIRQDLTTGEVFRVTPMSGNVCAVFGPSGLETETRLENIRVKEGPGSFDMIISEH